MRKASEPLLKVWKTRSVFWDLEYWHKLDTPHCLDQMEDEVSGMKSHDCHVMMTQILPVALRGIMDKHVRDTLIGLQLFRRHLSKVDQSEADPKATGRDRCDTE